ncbi:MAG: PIN domain-containing protein [Acidobacteria bacterium]|nr:PIN domain-containing protein [Acidobacteriota bacterium]
MLVVDASVLIYAANQDSEFHAACRAWLERQRQRVDAWYTTWPILYEFLRVSTHRQVLRRPWTAAGAWSFVESLLRSPGLGILTPTERHAEIAAHVVHELPQLSGNRFHDAHTAVLMREHGIRRICTRDTDFHQFPFLDVLDPIRDSA